MDSFTGIFETFRLDFRKTYFSNYLWMALSTFDCSVVSTSIANKLHEQLLKNTLKLMNYIMLLPFTYKQLKQIMILRKTVKKKNK